VPDLDGDGLGDVLVGTPRDDPGGVSDAGTVRVYSGATGALLWQRSGDSAGDLFGHAVAGVPDLDGDGLGDVVVGAPRDDPAGRSDSGSAWVLSGATGALLWKSTGDTVGDLHGSAVGGVPDADGDGFGDVVVGAPEDDPAGVGSGGSAYVYSGASGLLLWRTGGTALNDHLGAAVAGCGDLDGDGLGDVLVGAPDDDVAGVLSVGTAFVRSGASGVLLWQVSGDTAGDQLGAALAGVPDLDGDGLWDVAVGAPRDDAPSKANAGAVHAHSGATGVRRWSTFGAAAGDMLGTAVSGVPDLDGDLVGDVIAGAPFEDPSGLANAGGAHVLSGIGGVPLWTGAGGQAGALLGASVAGIPDRDGDGQGDFAVGAPDHDVAGIANAGAVFVHGSRGGDETAPEIACPDDLVVEATGPGGAVVSFHVVAFDDVDVAPSVVASPASGSLFPLGETEVLCTATDAAGNVGSCSFLVVVRDTTAPSIECPEDLVVECEGTDGTPVTFAPVAADAVDPAPEVSCSPASGAAFPLGTTTVEVTARDASGNESVCWFDVRGSTSRPWTAGTRRPPCRSRSGATRGRRAAPARPTSSSPAVRSSCARSGPARATDACTSSWRARRTPRGTRRSPARASSSLTPRGRHASGRCARRPRPRRRTRWRTTVRRRRAGSASRRADRRASREPCAYQTPGTSRFVREAYSSQAAPNSVRIMRSSGPRRRANRSPNATR
jgi:hypothetical protein